MAEPHPTCPPDSSEEALQKEAERLLRVALSFAPRTPEAVNMVAAAAQEASLPGFAEEILRDSLRDHPTDGESHHLLGCALRDQWRYESALASLRHAVSLNPDIAAFHINLADTLRRTGALEESEAHCRRALALDRQSAPAHFTSGNTHYQLGRFDEALAAYREALALDPAHAGAHRNLAVSLFLRGNFAEAYDHYEWRWRLKGFRGSLERLERPAWNGEPLAGRTLLVHAEQGLGDTLQFIRYVPRIAKEHGRIVLQAQRPLARLLSQISGVDAVMVRGEPLPAFDVHCPLLSLPRVFHTALETIPATVPYLRMAQRPSVKRAPAALHVGVAWSGNPRHTQDCMRSIPFQDFALLFDVPGVRFYRMHTRGDREEEACVHPQLVDPTEGFTDLAETAGFVQGLDLVISVDTAIAHLAGALGKAVWTLTPFAPDWRWMLGRSDSPWYPTMRLFRQAAPGEWGSVIRQVKALLESQGR